MKKTVKFVSVVLVIISIFLSLSACGGIEDEIIGMWYDDDGEVLSVQKDGTYNFEGEYGSGTWKILDDDETIEFTDFYGMTKNIEITEDDLGQYIFYHQEKLYKDVYPSQTEDDANQSNEVLDDNVAPEISIKEAGLFSSGCAWVVYDENGTEYNGLIDKNGKLLFSKEETTTVENFYAIDDGLGYFFVYPNYYTLINSKGKVLGSSENKDFDYVLGYGDGQALVYKKVADISTVKHMYGVLDSNGNWVYPLTDWSVEPSLNNSGEPVSFYAKEGMFVVRVKASSYYTPFMFFNVKTLEKFYLYNVTYGEPSITKIDFEFNQGIAILGAVGGTSPGFISKSLIKEYVSLYTNDTRKDVTVLPENFLLYTNGTFKEIPSFRERSKCFAIYKNNNRVKVNNFSKDISFEISEYEFDRVNLTFTNDCILMSVRGLDDKTYFSLIDSNTGNKRFEPIGFTTVDYSEGIIVYKDENINEQYKVLDSSGKLLADSLVFEEIKKYNDSLAAAKQTDGSWVYIDNSGKIVIDAINK